jgi:hypothetical protein
MKIVKQCMLCGKDAEIELTEDQYNRYKASQKHVGLYIQEALSELTSGQREFLISGTHEQCFDDAFKEEE